jgi:hypothetical protein
MRYKRWKVFDFPLENSGLDINGCGIYEAVKSLFNF